MSYEGPAEVDPHQLMGDVRAVVDRILADPAYAARIKQLAMDEDYEALATPPSAVIDGLDRVQIPGPVRVLPMKDLMQPPPFGDLMDRARDFRRSLSTEGAPADLEATVRRVKDHPGDTIDDLRTLLGAFARSTDDLAELLPPFRVDEKLAGTDTVITLVGTSLTVTTTATVTTAACLTTTTTTTTTTTATTTTLSHFCPHHLKQADTV